jgi:hypothetical protein
VPRHTEEEPEPSRASLETRRIGLIEILVVAGGFVAILGSALLPPGLGQLALGMLGFVLVLAALVVLGKGRAARTERRPRGAPTEAPPASTQGDERDERGSRRGGSAPSE